MTAGPPVREARLRPEFAQLYPGVEPGVWYTAATLAEHLLGRLVRQDAAEAAVPERILDDTHFEFRGEPGLKGGRIILGG
jgi:hypothetical protein